jgi:gamma-glutamylputrescine oxidase
MFPFPDVENTEAFGFNEVITEALESFLFTHLLHPDQAMVEYRWTGIIGIGPQKLPLIERVSPNVFAGVRLSGMGIALASTIGDKLAAMVWQQ